MEPLLVCAPLAVEAFALGSWERAASPRFPARVVARAFGTGERADVRVVRTGMGAARSRRAAKSLAREPGRGVVVAGFGGGLDPSLEPGDVVVADAVSGPDGHTTCVSDSLAEALRAAGLRVKVGTIACRDHVVVGDERRALFEQGACAVDMESAWLAAAASGRPFAVVRAVVDTPSRELSRVLATLRGGTRGLQSLSRVGRALARFAF